MSATTLYFILILDNLRDTLIGVMAIGLMLVTILAIFLFNSILEDDKELVCKLRKILVPSTIMVIVASLVLAFLPTTKQAAVIAVLPPLVNSEAAQSEAKELYDLAKSWLKDVTASGPAAESE